ncbi:MAG: MarR family transcriptional regulator [Theionarchaea archaeon]|nr:MarR family transcriptional regulator [Theionarchaea archaeon]
MGDTLLQPVQKQILELLAKHKGLTLEEICETKNLKIPKDEVNTILSELTSLGFLHSTESDDNRKWFITYEGMATIRSDHPWP